MKHIEQDSSAMGLNAWTELCEICDWDEIEALRTLERHIQAKSPQPTGRTREVCIALTAAYVKIKAEVERQTPEC